jgi:hypothetical protein
MIKDDFLWLQNWYASHCNGDWEHSQGVAIETIDNPGWRIAINLLDTELEGKQFTNVEKELSEDDWYDCFLTKDQFEAACGPLNLPEVLRIFRAWAEE